MLNHNNILYNCPATILLHGAKWVILELSEAMLRAFIEVWTYVAHACLPPNEVGAPWPQLFVVVSPLYAATMIARQQCQCQCMRIDTIYSIPPWFWHLSSPTPACVGRMVINNGKEIFLFTRISLKDGFDCWKHLPHWMISSIYQSGFIANMAIMGRKRQ